MKRGNRHISGESDSGGGCELLQNATSGVQRKPQPCKGLETFERGRYAAIAYRNEMRLSEGEERWIDPFASTSRAAAGFGHFVSFFECMSAGLAIGRDDNQSPSLSMETFVHMPDVGGQVFFRNPKHYG